MSTIEVRRRIAKVTAERILIVELEKVVSRIKEEISENGLDAVLGYFHRNES